MNKYNNKPFWYCVKDGSKINAGNGFNPKRDGLNDWWFFASLLEWEVFEVLESFFDVSDIEKDKPLVVAQRDKIKITYKPDFTVYYKGKTFYIEAKGRFTESARNKLKYLACNRPELDYHIALVFSVNPYAIVNKERKTQIMKTELPFWYFSVDGLHDHLLKHAVDRKFFQVNNQSKDLANV